MTILISGSIADEIALGVASGIVLGTALLAVLWLLGYLIIWYLGRLVWLVSHWSEPPRPWSWLVPPIIRRIIP